MKKIALYIVTYRGQKRLEVTLPSIFESLKHTNFSCHVTVNIINNHSDFKLPACAEKHSNVNVIHNTLRPDWSSGHLSRNWNQALLHGFKDLTNPINDIVVCSQDDSIFKNEWLNLLVELHKSYDFIQNGHGDQFHSYTPDAVRKVGLWDERFCGLSRQAADYFWRTVMHNKERSSIQDPAHRRVLNPLIPDIRKAQNLLVCSDVREIDSVWDNSPHNNNELSQALINYKYGIDPYPWTAESIKNASPKFKGHNFVTYPYFEKHVDLHGKNYIGVS